MDNPTSKKDLGINSLCNVIYEVICKVLSNRMKQLISKCISSEQSAIVENKSIFHNVLVAIEPLNHLKCKMNGKIGEMALKIDINKACDRVDWNYLKCMILKLGFNNKKTDELNIYVHGNS